MTSHPHLRRLKIHRYEQFVDVPEIVFSPDTNLILGLNGAGKTRLLRLLHAVTADDFKGLVHQEFDVEFERALPDGLELTARVQNTPVKPPPVMIGVEASPRDARAGQGGFSGRAALRLPTGDVLDYEAENTARVVRSTHGPEMRYDMASAPYRFVDITPAVLGLRPEVGWRPDMISSVWQLERARGAFVREDASDFEGLVEKVHFTMRVHAPSGLELSVTDTDPEWIGELVPCLFQRTRLWSAADGDIARQLSDGWPMSELRTPSAVSRAGTARPRVAAAEILQPLRAQGIRFRPLDKESQARVAECRGLELRVKFESGKEVASSELTFGQRRFLAMALLFWALPERPVLIDEIDNGLHPGLVEAVLKMGAGRQLILASHNKLVIDYTNFDGPEDVQKKIHIVERRDDGQQTVRTLDDATAREVFEKISVAIQSPSDVLLAEGLW